jgi:hypothetical protein
MNAPMAIGGSFNHNLPQAVRCSCGNAPSGSSVGCLRESFTADVFEKSTDSCPVVLTIKIEFFYFSSIHL